MPKLNYFLRKAPCFLNKEILEKYDSIIRNALEDILNVKLDGRAWEQSTLPIKLGGLGIKLASEVALPGYLSSAYATNSIVQRLIPDHMKEDQNVLYEQGVQEWKVLLGSNDLPDNPHFQSEWDSPLYGKRHKNLLESAPSKIEKARLLAVSSENSSDYMPYQCHLWALNLPIQACA